MASALLGASLLVCCRFGAAADAVPPAPTTVAPTGDYHVAWLTLSKAWFGDADLPVRLGVRGGKVVAAWFLVAEQTGNGQRMWSHQITAAINGERLTGDIAGRRCTAGMGGVIGDYTFTLDARISQGELAGTYKARIGAMGGGRGAPGEARHAAGALSGILRDESQMKKVYPLAGDWPGYFGASGGMVYAVSTSLKLYALRTADGQTAWQTPLAGIVLPCGSSAAEKPAALHFQSPYSWSGPSRRLGVGWDRRKAGPAAVL
jgi:hypothetical protein